MKLLDYNFLPPSTKATARPVYWFDCFEDLFRLCPKGKSFRISKDSVKLSTLRAYVSKNFRGRFKVIPHDNCYEIYRKE